MPSYVYILECADGSYYTGSTKDLGKRLWQHQHGEGANYTQERLPVKLVYCEAYDRIEDAFWREKQVQGWSRLKKQALIGENNDKLVELSKNYTEHGKPLTEPVEGSGDAEEQNRINVLPDPAAASTGSASAHTVDNERMTPPANKPLSEPIEGSGDQK
jgi:putative endonuclease